MGQNSADVDNFASVVNVMIAMGLYEKTRGEARRAAIAG